VSFSQNFFPSIKKWSKLLLTNSGCSFAQTSSGRERHEQKMKVWLLLDKY